jgi:DNA polymerase elongation subunit (family B)
MPSSFTMQIFGVESTALPIDDGDGDAVNLAPVRVDDEEWLRRQQQALRPGRNDDRRETVVLDGRDGDGRSVRLYVAWPLVLLLELPARAAQLGAIKGYLLQMQLQLLEGYRAIDLCDLDLPGQAGASYTFRQRANDWVPSKDDHTKPQLVATVRLEFETMQQYRAVRRYLEATKYRGGTPLKVWEGPDIVRHPIRMLLELGLRPGGCVRVKRSAPAPFCRAYSDAERVCRAADLEPDTDDQSLWPHTKVSLDLEVVNGTEAEFLEMRALGLDRFPKATNPTNAIIQCSFCIDTADGRRIDFLLELDTVGGGGRSEPRKFEGGDYTVLYYGTEQALILGVRDLIVYYDADILLTFNGDYFDWPYLFARAGLSMSKGDPAPRLCNLGRDIGQSIDSQYVQYDLKTDTPVVTGRDDSLPRRRFPIWEVAQCDGGKLSLEPSGRIMFDLCAFVQSQQGDPNMRFTNYTLDNMATRYLGDQKVGIKHNDIFASWAGLMTTARALEILGDTPAPWLPALAGGRTVADFCSADGAAPFPAAAQKRLLADYCIKDSRLPIRIVDKLGLVLFLWQVSRVSSTPPHNVLNNGQQMRVKAMFVEEAWSQGRLVNKGRGKAYDYEGATVLDPMRGYYGGGAGKTLRHGGGAVPNLAPLAEIRLPPTVEDRAAAAAACTAQVPAEARADLAPLVRRVVDELPKGCDFGGLELTAVIQTEVDDAVLSLDFASLYPSIMRSHALCPSTLFGTFDRPHAEVEPRPDPSGLVLGLPDEPDFWTVCVTSIDPVTGGTARRYHKVTKHDFGVMKPLQERLSSERKRYKKRMNVEKRLLDAIDRVSPDLDPGVRAVGETDPALVALRAVEVAAAGDKATLYTEVERWVAVTAPSVVAGVRAAVAGLAAVYDGRQRALKVGANSVYGVLGLKVGTDKSPCSSCEVAEMITAIGRWMIMRSKHAAETEFEGCRVIYGDTDSIFVHTLEPDDQKAWTLANAIAKHCTEVLFAGTVNVLEDECIKRLLALWKKKNYVAIENEDRRSGVYHRAEKGVATVRRDKPPVLTKLLTVLNGLITTCGYFPLETIVLMMLRACCRHFEALAQDAFPVEDYVIVQRINKLTKQSAHLVMAEKLRKRANMPIRPGDSVAYCHITGPERLATQRVESPIVIRASAGKVKIDRAYYLNNKLDYIRGTLAIFLPPELIDQLFQVYRMAIERPHLMPLEVAMTPGAELSTFRRAQLERSLATAVRIGRLPRKSVIPEPQLRVLGPPRRKRQRLNPYQKTKAREEGIAMMKSALLKGRK